MSESKLQFYWYETKPDETIGNLWGQLTGAAHRLRFVVDMFEQLTDDVRLDAAEMIARLEYNAYSYYYVVYEMRERAVGLVASICSSKVPDRRELEGSLKHSKKRENALGIVERQAPHLKLALRHLLDVLDHDIGLRNMHTHKIFLSLGLWTNHGVYDPVDVLNNDMQGPGERACFEDLLRTESKKLAEEYRVKAQKAIEATFDLLRVSMNDSRRKFVKAALRPGLGPS